MILDCWRWLVVRFRIWRGSPRQYWKRDGGWVEREESR
jgi:hypothetical protein